MKNSADPELCYPTQPYSVFAKYPKRLVSFFFNEMVTNFLIVSTKILT